MLSAECPEGQDRAQNGLRAKRGCLMKRYVVCSETSYACDDCAEGCTLEVDSCKVWELRIVESVIGQTRNASNAEVIIH